MVKLLNQIGMNTDYLENASINKIVVYDNNKLWNFVINNDRILPVYIYNELINKIKVTFSSIDNIKLRYFILPIIVISLMIFIVDSDNDVINKEVVSLNYDISYPFFSNDDIDNYISSYLNYDSYIDGNVIIDYDIYDNDNLYYLTFYKYFWNDNVVSDGSDSFVIDISNNSVSRINKTNYEYDVVINRKIDKSKKMIALTFDDGPNYNTSKVIDVLNKYDIKATFFVLGSRAINNKDILKKMADSGMEIGNHTYNHLLLTKYDEDKIRRLNNTNYHYHIYHNQ